ncbi:MAG: hypothetical protein IPL33_20970, partial [Sphingobacteriales bacterium]|nr:hypothetical protein [Sphingobacteriales bacterium]
NTEGTGAVDLSTLVGVSGGVFSAVGGAPALSGTVLATAWSWAIMSMNTRYRAAGFPDDIA